MNIRYKLCILLYYGFAKPLPESIMPIVGTAAKEYVRLYAAIYCAVVAMAIVLSKVLI